jgi:hypothetical protein
MYTAVQIRKMLETQDFAEWYKNKFEDYISGEEDISRETIEKDITKLLP